MSPFAILIAFSIAMFSGSLMAGIIPLILSQYYTSKFRWLVAFGAGMMLSSCTQVIIPEVFYQSKITTQDRVITDANFKTEKLKNDQRNLADTHYERNIGLIFTLGFLLMYTVHNMVKQMSRRSAASNWVTTFGMCIHSAADGMVIAFAVLNQNKSFRFIVLLAMAIHKAPAAFGLVTHLLNDEDIPRKFIAYHLLLFSLTSPLVAIITFIAYNQLYNIRDSLFDASVPLLFSAGTFLYIATSHTVPNSNHCNLSKTSAESIYAYMAFFILGNLTVCALSIPHAH